MADSTSDELNALRDELSRLREVMGRAAGQTNSFAQTFPQAMKQIGNGATGFATAMANGQQGASAFNGVINSSSAALGTLLQSAGLLGTAFGKLTGFAAEYMVRANQQGDALFKSFQDLSRVGGAGADGLKGVFGNMQQFGLTMNQLPEFGAMITQNSEALAVLGGTVSQGTKAFAGVAAGIQQSGLQAEFERMGLTTKNINEGTANYLKIQTLTNAGVVKSTAQLTAGAEEYIRQQDKLSRLTGKSADALAKEAETRQANERYAAVSLELQMKADAARAAGDEAGARAAEDQMKQNEILLSRTPAALKQGVMDLMSGFVNSPEARKMYIALPEMSQAIISQNFKAAKVIDAGAKEADASTKRNIGLAKAGVNDIIQASYAAQRELSRLKGEEAEQAATKQIAVLAKGGDVDINNQVALREAQRATTMALDNLVNHGVGPVTAGMLKLATGIEKVITVLPKEYIGAKTSVSARPGEPGSGRGVNASATAGYGTRWKPGDLVEFVNATASKAYAAMTKPLEVERPNSTQTYEGLSGRTSNITGSNVYTGLSGIAGPNTTYRTNLGDTTPTNAPTLLSSQESSAGNNAELTQSIMTLANNIGLQTSSTNELVELMRRSVGTQAKILQQTRN